MTPTKIHFTKGEKRRANAAASLRHYEKKREHINALRRLQYARKSRSEKSKAAPPSVAQGSSNSCKKGKTAKVPIKLIPMDPEQIRMYRVEHLMGLARTIPSRLVQLTFGSSRRYFDDLCQQFHMDLVHHSLREATEVLDHRRRKFESLLDGMKSWRHDILNLSGCGEEWKEVEAIANEIRRHVEWISELESFALLDPEGVIEYHKKGKLQYQKELPQQ